MKLIVIGFGAFDFDEKSIFRVHQYFLQYYHFKTISGSPIAITSHKQTSYNYNTVSTLEILCNELCCLKVHQ